MEMQRLQEHIQAHLELLRKSDKDAAKEVEAEIAGLLAGGSQPVAGPQEQAMGAPAEMPVEAPPAAMPEPVSLGTNQGAEYAA